MRTTTFRAFWPLYLRAHRRRNTRRAHYAGILFGAAMTVLAAATLSLWPLLAGVAGAAVMTVGSHWVFEGRRPLLLGNPLLAAAADLRMFFLAATGRLEAELARHGIDAGRDAVFLRRSLAARGLRRTRRRTAAGKAASGVAGLMLAIAVAVLALEGAVWWRSGAWEPISVDAALRRWGIVITEIGQTKWVDRIDEAILSVPLTVVLFAAATSALTVARRMKPAAKRAAVTRSSR